MAKRGMRATADDVVVINTKPHPLRDVYYWLIRMPAPAMLAFLAVALVTLNATDEFPYPRLARATPTEPSDR